jgi:hypothetical protein
MNAIAGVYCYSDIVLMTDEEENKGTDRWPSMENIVSFLSRITYPRSDN